MKTYSLKDFLTKPINAIIENEDDYCFELKGNSLSVNNANENIIDAIKIPLIQRDYAQGRNSNEDLRNEFLRKYALMVLPMLLVWVKVHWEMLASKKEEF